MEGPTFVDLLPYILSAGTSIAIIVYAWGRSVAGSRPFAVLATAQSVATLGHIFELVSVSPQARIFWENIQTIALLVWPAAYFVFALRFTGRPLPGRKIVWAALAAPFVVSLALLFTDAPYGLVRVIPNLEPSESLTALFFGYSLSIYIVAFYSYSFIIAATYFLGKKYIDPSPLYRGQVGTVIVGTMIPVVVSVLTATGIRLTFQRDPTPITFALGNLVVAWGLYRYRLFDLVPVARDSLIESMREGVIVLDLQHRIVDSNPAARELLGRRAANLVGKPAESALAPWPELLAATAGADPARFEMTVERGTKVGVLEARLESIDERRGLPGGQMLVLRDISERTRVERELARHRQELEAIVAERTKELTETNSRLSKEVEERKRAQEDLGASETRLMDFLNALPMGVVVHGPNTTLRYVNKRAISMFGISAEAAHDLDPMRARTLQDAIKEFPMHLAGDGEPYPRERSPVLLALRGEQVRADDIEVAVDGQRVPLEVLASPIFDEQGKVQFAVTTFQDISDRVHLEGTLDAIYRLGRDLALIRDEEAIGRRVVEEVHHLLDFELVGLGLADHPTGQLIYGASILGIDDIESVLRLPLDGEKPKSISAHVYRTGEPMNVPDVSKEPLYHKETQEWEGRSELCVPIRVGDRILGVLNAESRQLNRFSRDDERLLQTLADQCGVAVENARLYAKVKEELIERRRIERQLHQHQEQLEELVMVRTVKLSEASERLATLNDASRVLGVASTDPVQVYEAIHRAVSWLMPAQIFTITMLDHQNGYAEDVYVANHQDPKSEGQYALSGSFADYMLNLGESLWIGDVQLFSEKVSPMAGFLRENTKSALAVLLPGADKPMGVMLAQCDACTGYSEEDVKILEMLAAHAATAIENAQLYQVAQRAAADEERQRLARHLHDSVTQSLYSLTLMTNGWAAMSEKNELKNPAESFRQLEQLGVQALGEMRLLIHQLRPPVLEETGLIGALQERLEAVEHRVGLETQLVTEGDVEGLPRQVEEELFHITQEALNNALRHADASNIWVRIAVDNGSARLAIEDDGCGFDPANNNGGLGLTTMRERAESVGGELKLATGSGKGTVVEVLLALS
ncbi:MAG: hypothetical protein BMS9Abin28_1146 [Anaerolineae bacterium]|nr:MAG: hypothetical protein BMS9Abin28_1146 [Anaerolineae bacterium]